MAITLTMTRELNYNSALISAFTTKSIAFTVDWGGATATAVTIESTIDGTVIVFTPVKTLTAGTVDTFFFDFSDILKYVLGLPPTHQYQEAFPRVLLADLGLSKSFTYDIKIAGSAVTDGETVELAFITYPFGYSAENEAKIVTYGTSNPIYHNGVISFYNPAGAGTYNLNINDVTVSYTLVAGYNLMELDVSQRMTGILYNLTSNGLALPLKYKNIGDPNLFIYWIDEDGKYSAWRFRKLSEEYQSESSNEIPIFPTSNQYQYANSRKIQKTVTRVINLDTIAFDETHYNQLIMMANSPCIIYDQKLWEVSSCSDSAAECKQNLNFKLSLKASQNAVSY